MESLLIGIAGGVGVALVLWLGRFESTTAESASGTEDLESWVADETRRLKLEIAAIREAVNKKNLLDSSHHGELVAAAKERALHAFRRSGAAGPPRHRSATGGRDLDALRLAEDHP